MRGYVRTAAALLLAVPALTAGAASAAEFRKGPDLVYRGDPTKMTVVWQADGPARRSLVQWGHGRRLAASSGALRPAADGLYEHTIAGLSPGRRYSYRVIVDRQRQSGSFLAAPGPSAERLSLYAYGDTRSHPDDHDRVCAAILRDMAAGGDARRTLCLHSGDWVADGDKESDWDEQYFDRRRPNALALMACVPIQGCRGNHERGAALLRKYWPYEYVRPPACYYSFDYGPVHVTVIDQYTDYAPGSEQHAWIEKDLADTDRPWRIVLWHQPAWSAGGHRDDTRAQKLQPLFEKAGVDLVLAGHNHYYARCDVDGLPHVTTGGGGAPLRDAEKPGGRIVASRRTHHFMRLDVAKTALTATAIDTRGATIDTFRVSRRSRVRAPAPAPEGREPAAEEGAREGAREGAKER